MDSNINYELCENNLIKLFQVFGTVINAVIKRDKHTGKSRGYGFVTMQNTIEATRAVEGLNRRFVAGRQMVVYLSNSEKGYQDRPHIEKTEKKGSNSEPYFDRTNLVPENDLDSQVYKSNFSKTEIDDSGLVRIKFEK